MAVCKLTNDILRSTTCGYSLKQITDLYLANYEDVVSTTLGTEGNTVKTIVMKTSGSGSEQTTAVFYHIEPNKDSASYEDTLQVGDGGSKYRATSLTWNNGGTYDGNAVDNLDALSLGRFIAVAKLTDGSYIMFGRNVGLEASAATLQSAQEATGFNGSTITLGANTVESPLPLESTAIAVVLGIEEND